MASVVACHIEQEGSSTPGRCWWDARVSLEVLGQPVQERKSRCGHGGLLSVLQSSEMPFQARCISFPTCLSLAWIRGLGAHQAKQLGMESLQETQHFPLASLVVFTFLLSVCSHLYWQPSLPARC